MICCLDRDSTLSCMLSHNRGNNLHLSCVMHGLCIIVIAVMLAITSNHRYLSDY
jgi:hypothetical protein